MQVLLACYTVIYYILFDKTRKPSFEVDALEACLCRVDTTDCLQHSGYWLTAVSEAGKVPSTGTTLHGHAFTDGISFQRT